VTSAQDGAERVLLAVRLIPAGQVASYGAIAAITGTSPRQVGRILRERGGAVPWWRVTSRDGGLPGPLLAEARTHWDAEGMRLTPDGGRCRMALCGTDLDALDAAFRSEVHGAHRQSEAGPDLPH
jgi:Predicted methylated DNA-protein cysteine methyltransferase